MQEITRYHCGICNKAFEIPEKAQKCESVGCEELRVKLGDYCYIIEEIKGFFGWRIRCKRARVVEIEGPMNPLAFIVNTQKSAPHLYNIVVATKNLEEIGGLRDADKQKLPRYSQCRIYVPAARR